MLRAVKIVLWRLWVTGGDRGGDRGGGVVVVVAAGLRVADGGMVVTTRIRRILARIRILLDRLAPHLVDTY